MVRGEQSRKVSSWKGAERSDYAHRRAKERRPDAPEQQTIPSR